jgi:ATP-dependent exoDNAse (exonuclease V) beta subunit
MTDIPDLAQRSQALDPLRSFCVTAPAGSGKTELLIQRFLTLLARVELPEQILAITFTRKAAAEMLERINAALAGAREPKPPADTHAALTWKLARNALDADARYQWGLLENPARLNIKTIDSYCSSLTRQLPILSHFGGSVSVADDPNPFYRQAARTLLDTLEQEADPGGELARLLLLYDNNWPLLENLLVRMLSRRDQWLAYMGTGLDPVPASEALTRTAIAVVEDALLELLEQLGEEQREDIWNLLGYSCDNLGQPFPLWPLSSEQSQLSQWRSIAALLLTNEGNWRKTIDKRVGFPTDAGEGKAAAKAMKERHAACIADLSTNPAILPLLQQLPILPSVDDDNLAWQRVIGLSQLLPRLAAQLVVVFQQQGVVDYAQIAIAARQALGDDDNPTDLALKLDYSLRHILLDEFQDTSTSQFELVRRLTRGWREDNESNPENPRTFFVVGDGMQSIYGFRDADVGMFMHARDYGFNGIEPGNLVLCSNFRSDPKLVDWVNESFVDAFPATDNTHKGEIAFSAASAVKPHKPGCEAVLRAFCGETESAREAEARAVAEVIEEGLADADCESIAVLVRTRSHLAHIVAQLRNRGIDWQARDIDPLAGSAVVVDLMSLCRALHNHCDRVAWLALLRAPWCGLELGDLQALLRGQHRRSVPDLLSDPSSLACLSEQGRRRAGHAAAVLNQAIGQRERLGLRDWIESTWIALGGPASAGSINQLQDARYFLQLLEELDNRGQGYSDSAMIESLATLYSGGSGASSKVHLMTLHKSKGLEFDRVIIPGLARRPRSDDRELLLWDRFHNRGETGFLMAVDDPVRKKEATLYNFLKHCNASKRSLEATRLLYVGVTRAVKQLYLFATLDAEDDGLDYRPPPSQSLLQCIWDDFSRSMQLVPVESAASSAAVADSPANLWRLSGVQPMPAAAPEQDSAANIPLLSDNQVQRATGTVIHQALQRLSNLDAQQFSAFEIGSWKPWLEQQLRALFVSEAELPAALATVSTSLGKVLNDETGCWILASDRQQAISEYPLSTLREDGRLLELIVDRTFIDRGVRWVVDYKSSTPEPGEALNDFLCREEQRYRAQLESYRQAFEQMESIPVKTALYFTSIPCWHEFDTRALPA